MLSRVTEFHNIMPISNIVSVLQHGILSHERVTQLPHIDVSMADVQELRDKVNVPGGMKLHQYANLYFDARNPMMFKRKHLAENLCVLSINREILNAQDVVITDQNASSRYVRFLQPSQIHLLDMDMVYAEDWRHEVNAVYWRQKSVKCAEVLVPNNVPNEYIQKAYVVSSMAESSLREKGFFKEIQVKPELFFR